MTVAAAFSRVNFAIVSRSVRGGDAVMCAAYNLCAKLDHGNRSYDFTRKSAEHKAHSVLLPAGSPVALCDPGTLWRAAEAAERRVDAQTARQVLFSIPREVPPGDRLAFAEAIARPWVADGMAVMMDIHSPCAADGIEQPHVHYLLSLRRLTHAGFSKAKARDWNVIFRESDGKAERSRIEARANLWMEAHGIAARLDLRSLTDRGDDRPPEPEASRADWQRWLRDGSDPDVAPIAVAAVLNHRRQRRALAADESEAAQAGDEAASLSARIARTLPESQKPIAWEARTLPLGEGGAIYAPLERIQNSPNPMESADFEPPLLTVPAAPELPSIHAKESSMAQRPSSASRAPARGPAQRRKTVSEPWMRGGGGFDALPDHLQESARRSYEKWIDRRPWLAKRYNLVAYTAYVQDRRDEKLQPENEDGISAAAATDRDTGRRVHLQTLLSGHYAAPEELAPLVKRMRVDLASRTAVLELFEGGRLVDHGDKIRHTGNVTSATGEALAVVAAAHGWKQISVSGSKAFRDAVAEACALRRPPILTDHPLRHEAAARVQQALRERAAAAVPVLDVEAIRAAAVVDPATSARKALDYAEATARSALTGKPNGSRDPSEIARPRILELIERRDTALADAREAFVAAAAHRSKHTWPSRLLDGSARRRQAAMDAESIRANAHARALNRGHEMAVRQAEKAAKAEALATATAAEDWRWSMPVRAAETQLTLIAAIRTAVNACNETVLAAVSQGDLRAAGAAVKALATARTKLAATAGAALDDSRPTAILALHALEQRIAADPQALVRVRSITAAALAGDLHTIAAASRGDMAAATEAAETWQAAQQRAEEDRRRKRDRRAALTSSDDPPGYN